MKKKGRIIKLFIFGSSFLLLIGITWAQPPQDENFQIRGSFNGVQSGMIRMLSFDSEKVEDSARIVNGKFSLKGSIGIPERKLFQITPGIWSFLAFVEPGSLAFTIDTTGAQHSGEIGKGGFALIWQISEEGSQMADVYNSYLEQSELFSVKTRVLALKDSLKEAHGNAQVERNINNEIDSLTNNMLYEQKTFMEMYVDSNPSSVAGAFLLAEYYISSSSEHNSSRNYLGSMLPKFKGQAKESIYYKRLTKKSDALKKTSVHEMAPDFTLLKRDSSDFTLSSLKGSYVLLDFWASWCGPCRSAIPHWKEVNAKYAPNGLKIVSVSIDRSWNDWKNALDKEQMPWTQLVDDFGDKNQRSSRVSNLYPTPTIPFYVLIDKAGKILLSTGDEGKITAKIDQLMK